MSAITTCTSCGAAYEAGSEEQAHEARRLCRGCREILEAERFARVRSGLNLTLKARPDGLVELSGETMKTVVLEGGKPTHKTFLEMIVEAISDDDGEVRP